MAVQDISKERFDSHNPFRKRSADNALFKEVAWFKDVQAETIGLVVENKQHGDFSAVSFASSCQVGYCSSDMTVAIPSFSEAREHLAEIMRAGTTNVGVSIETG